MDLTTTLTGGIPLVLILASALSAVSTLLLLWRYRRATIAAMAESAGTAPAEAPAAEPGAAPARSLAIDDGELVGAPARPYARRAGWVYATAGLVYAALMSVPYQMNVEGGFSIERFLWITACHAWPVPWLLGWAVALDRRDRWRFHGLYWLLYLGVCVVIVLRSENLSLAQLFVGWLAFNIVPTVLMLTFNNRRTRAVGPLVLAVAACGVLGAFGFLMAVGADPVNELVVGAAMALGLGTRTTLVAIPLIGFVLVGLVGWVFFGRLGRAYRAKRFSDQTLTIGSAMLVFGVAQSTNLAFEHPAWALSGLVAFVAFKFVASLGLRALPRPADGPGLLLLRVFALGQRSERLFDSVSQAWRRHGPIHLIAGPDLATTTLEAHEFLDFVGGRLARAFVSGEADLEKRIAALDRRPDPDGRFRVNEFFCRADTWKPTMRRLAGESEVVLMDLRSFSPANRGCLFEIEQLVHHVELERIVLLIGASTDRSFLESQLQAIWGRLAASSPNRELSAPTLRLFDGGSGRVDVRPLLATLFGVADRRERSGGADPMPAPPRGRNGTVVDQ